MLTLKAVCGCKKCGGMGTVNLTAEEITDCDCIYPTNLSDSQIEQIEQGLYDILPCLPTAADTVTADKCKVCGYPLILKANDPTGEYDSSEYEDECEGMCGSCHCYPKGIRKFT